MTKLFKATVLGLGLFAMAPAFSGADTFYARELNTVFKCTNTNAALTEYDCLNTGTSHCAVESVNYSAGDSCGHFLANVYCDGVVTYRCPDGTGYVEEHSYGCVSFTDCR